MELGFEGAIALSLTWRIAGHPRVEVAVVVGRGAGGVEAVVVRCLCYCDLRSKAEGIYLRWMCYMVLVISPESPGISKALKPPV